MRRIAAATTAGGRQIAPGEVFARLNREGRVGFRLSDEHGNATPGSYPNGPDDEVKIFIR
ncbi:hypothetical protein [Methanoculleus chikugoensis]|uniref:Uncharacterized protein n=1 Tax=Methanoculleus chikugoensis TaxID=118126 RepID=A0ABN5XK21_9EURY|nr:hypothetical protein [Methanoculleus chikugoensis]BBL68962.1 hypothetical protein MchiMG62_21430 [Methanoculleus chikugoensis]